MKATNILKSKRGVAIENAILFILVVFSLCSLLTMIALIANYQFKIDNIVLKQDVDLDQIGEEFLYKLTTVSYSGDFSLTNDQYTCSAKDKNDDGKHYIFTVAPKNSDQIVLYIEAQKIDGQVAVLSWRYSAPPTPETDPPNS